MYPGQKSGCDSRDNRRTCFVRLSSWMWRLISALAANAVALICKRLTQNAMTQGFDLGGGTCGVMFTDQPLAYFCPLFGLW